MQFPPRRNKDGRFTETFSKQIRCKQLVFHCVSLCFLLFLWPPHSSSNFYPLFTQRAQVQIIRFFSLDGPASLSGQRTEHVKTGHVKTDRFRGDFRGHFRGRHRGTFRGESLRRAKTGKSTFVGTLVGTLVGALVGVFEGPLVDPLVGSNFAVRVLCAWRHLVSNSVIECQSAQQKLLYKAQSPTYILYYIPTFQETVNLGGHFGPEKKNI